MGEEEIKTQIEQAIAGAQVHVEGDGRHFQATIISDAFAGKSRLQQHRLVYDALGSSFDTEALHALAIRTFTPQKWSTEQGVT